MMRSLNLRLQKIESELIGDELEPVIDPEMEARRHRFIDAMAILIETMSPEHWQLVSENLRAFADGETAQRDALTITFLTRAARYVRGDARPLTLPPEVASLYLENRPLQQTLNHECLSCGYDVKDMLAEPRFALCPICGGEYEPVEAGEGVTFTRFYKGWSKANPDKVVEVYLSPTGGVPW